MSDNLTAILTTIINVSVFIENIILNIKKFNRNTQNVLFLVVTDKKTNFNI